MTALDFLVGTWTGAGQGEYPTISSFSYGETVSFSTVPTKSFVVYHQKTWHSETKAPLHTETGYLRPSELGVELVISQPTGLVEIHKGTRENVDGSIQLTFRSTLVAGSETAVEVSEVVRSIEVASDVLRYRLSMAAVGLPLTHHLSAELHRVT